MKRLFFLLTACLFLVNLSANDHSVAIDTVIVIENKRIEVKEEGERMKVNVYQITKENELVESEMIFEGHYDGDKSYERRKHTKSIQISIPTWDRNFDPHWAGFGIGFINFSDRNLSINDVDGIPIRSGNSLEYNLNILEKAFPFARNHMAFVTGAGIRWSRYRISGNQYFMELDGITSLHDAWDGIYIKKSKLNINSFTIPVLLEWQSRKRHSGKFFVSAGAVGVIKFSSTSKIQYTDEHGKKRKEKVDEGMNIRPVTMDILVQAGFKNISAYARYAPFELFENNKGPRVHPVALGLQLNF